jgi:hypothetical protein
MRLYGGVKVVVDRHRGELFLQRPHQPVERTLRIGTVDERLGDLRIHLRVLRAIDRHGVVALKVLLGVDGVFAVKHRHRLRVLQAGSAIGHRQEVARLLTRAEGGVMAATPQLKKATSVSRVEVLIAFAPSETASVYRQSPLFPAKQNLHSLMITID